MLDQATLQQLEAGYRAERPRQQAAQQVAKPKVSGAKRLLASALPVIGGALGAVGGSFAAPVAGTAAGGAAGSALGAALKQRLLGEKTNLGEIGKEAALGAVPGVFKGVKALKNAKVARQAAQEASASEQAAHQIAEQERTARLGRGTVSTTLKSEASKTAQRAAEAKRYNDLAKQNITRLSADRNAQTPIIAKGIPIKYESTTSTGKGVSQKVNKTLTNPTVQEIENTSKSLASGNYKTSTKLGRITGRQSLNGKGGTSVYEQSTPKSVVNIQGRRTSVPLTKSSSSTSVIPAKPQAQPTIPAAPSFASEGVELQPVPKVPIIPSRYKNMSGTPRQETAPTAMTSVTFSPTHRSLLGKLSTNRTRAASGIKTDPGVGGIERADEAAQAFQRLKISGTPEKQLRKINEVMASHGKQVDDILAKNPIQLDGTAVKAQVAKAIEDPLKYADLDLSAPGAQRALNAHLDKFAQAKTAKEVNDYVKTLNKVATRAKAKLDKGGTITDKEAAALAAKRSGDEVLSQYPEIAPLKKDMAVLFERNGDVTKASEKTLGVPILGIKSKDLEQTRRAVASKVGTGLAKTEKVASGPAGNVGKSLFNQFATRAVASPLLATDQSNSTDSTNQTTMMTNSASNIVPNTEQFNNTSTPDASTTDIDYEAEARNALASGNYKAFDAIMSLAALAEKKATSGKDKPLSAEASKVIANANSGLNSLSQLANIIQTEGVPKATVIPGRSAFGGLGANTLGTASYDTAAKNVADVITRLRTGAAITENEEAFYKSQLPQAFDKPEVIGQKMKLFNDLFTSIANRTGSAGTDLQQLATAEI